MKHIHTFENFMNEGMYQTYADYQKKNPKMKFGSADDMKKDVLLSVRHLLPMKWEDKEKFIKKVEDQSDDEKGIKFEITLKSGDVIHAYKVGPWSMNWEWYLNKKKKDKNDILDELEVKLYTPYERWQRHHDMMDKHYQYSDDHRVYTSGLAHEKFVGELYKKLNSSDKKKADKYIGESGGNSMTYAEVKNMR